MEVEAHLLVQVKNEHNDRQEHSRDHDRERYERDPLAWSQVQFLPPIRPLRII